MEAMPGANDSATERDRLHAARCRWLFTVLYLGGLRAAEVAETRMGAFFCRRDRDGMGRWWLKVTGKGNKTRLVPATDELIVELARYREAYGLPPMPLPGEARPIVLPIIGKEKPLSCGALHLVLKQVFGMAAERLRWLWTLRSHARSSSRVGLISGFCSSGRGFDPRFLQTPPRGDALALR
jgi:integrase